MSDEPNSGTVQVHGIQEGWLAIYFMGECPSPERRFHLLHQALQIWLSSHLQFRLQDIQRVEHRGELRGLNAFYSKAPVSTLTLAIEVDPEIARQYGSEYLEAVVTDAANIMAARPDGPHVVGIINRRHVAVVVDRQRGLAYVTYVENIKSSIIAEHRILLKNWLAQPTANHCLVELVLEAGEHKWPPG